MKHNKSILAFITVTMLVVVHKLEQLVLLIVLDGVTVMGIVCYGDMVHQIAIRTLCKNRFIDH